MNEISLNIAFAVYLVATMTYAAHLLSKRKSLSIASTGALSLGILFHTIALIGRWRMAGRPPVTNLYESMVLFAWTISVAYLIVQLKFRLRIVGPFAMLLSLLALGYASLLDSTIAPLVPALQSNWLTIHVVTCFMGYAAFAISFVSSIAYLALSGKHIYSSRPAVSSLDLLAYKTIAFGFLFLAVGIITGAVWANQAWGAYWSWDPKETWSLITWLIYAAYLHARVTAGWHGRKTAWLSVVGFLSVMFTYLGVNLLLGGLHSYK